MFLLVIIIGLSVAVVRQRAELLRVSAENKKLALQDRTENPGAANLVGQPSTIELPTPDSSVARKTPVVAPTGTPEVATIAAAPAEKLVMTPTGMAPEPRADGLALAGTHVVPIEGGLKASMKFNPTASAPLGLVAIVVRLPVGGESRILDLEPQGATAFSDVAKTVSENGKFAVFEGTPGSVEPLEFALSVSGPAVADVRGTTGIGAFDLNIGATGASASPK